jgi:dynamin GTPase effector domain-containing protein
MRDESVLRVKEIVEMEKFADYTCDPEYVSYWTRLMGSQDTFMKIVEGCIFDDNGGKITTMEIEGLGKVDLVHLDKYKHLAQEAFDMKMRMISYWKIVLKRMVDSVALYLLFSIRNLVNNNLEFEIIEEMTSTNHHRLQENERG